MTGKQLRNSILQWAIQGKLVPQDPNDEPASVLLERIRAEKARLIKEKKIKKDKNESIIYRGEDNSYYEKIVSTGEVKCIDDEIPFEIPQGWEWTRFRSIARQITDGTHSTPKYVEDGVPFISVKDMSSGCIRFNSTKYISEGEHKVLTSRCCPERGDLLLSKVGTTGVPALVETDVPFSIFVSLALIKFFNQFILPQYLVQLILSPLVQEQAKTNTRGVGNKNWVLTAISDTLLAIPPYKEQCRIIEKMNSLESSLTKYEGNEQELSVLNKNISDSLKQSILQEAIRGRLVPQIESDGTAEELLAQIRAEKMLLVKEGKLKKSAIANESRIFRGDDSKYYEQIGSKTTCINDQIPFEIPSSWHWIRLGEIVSMSMGKTPPRGEQAYWSNGGYPWVSISDMVDGGHITTTKEGVSEIAASHIFHSEPSPQGSLLMSFKLTIGKISILDIDAYHNEAIVTIIPFLRRENIITYLMMFLPMLSLQGDSKDAIKGKTLNSKSLYNILLPIPPSNEMNRILTKLKNVLSLT